MMNSENSIPTIRILTVGFDMYLVDDVFNAVAAKSPHEYMHAVHPRYIADNWPQETAQPGICFFRRTFNDVMPPPDYKLLASLEQEGLPTVHNMLLGDRVLSKIPYPEAMGYATMLVNRLRVIYEEKRPDVVLTGFDAMHCGLAMAVARAMEIPAFALNFSVIPAGYMSLCADHNPGSSIRFCQDDSFDRRELAERTLKEFEERSITARAYLAEQRAPLSKMLLRALGRIPSFFQTLRSSKQQRFQKYTDPKGGYSVTAAMSSLARSARRQRSLNQFEMLQGIPDDPYVLFGLHLQPESSIDVWAPFFSNQMWVIELLSRSIPPSHKLLVKIHKSDVTSYTTKDLNKMQSFPGVHLVLPSANTVELIEHCDLLIAIQGTMGLEAAMLGKPVIMLGHSAVRHFPSASTAGALRELPGLVRAKLKETRPEREEIIDGFIRYLEPFLPASDNHWTKTRTVEEIDAYVVYFDALRDYLLSNNRELANYGP